MMNSVLIASREWAALLAANVLVMAVLYVLEEGWGFRGEAVQAVKYERIELIQPTDRTPSLHPQASSPDIQSM